MAMTTQPRSPTAAVVTVGTPGMCRSSTSTQSPPGRRTGSSGATARGGAAGGALATGGGAFLRRPRPKAMPKVDLGSERGSLEERPGRLRGASPLGGLILREDLRAARTVAFVRRRCRGARGRLGRLAYWDQWSGSRLVADQWRNPGPSAMLGKCRTSPCQLPPATSRLICRCRQGLALGRVSSLSTTPWA